MFKMVSNKEFRLLVVGSRTFADYALLKTKLDAFLAKVALTHEIIIVSGGAKGADRLAEAYAREKGYQCEVFKADWATYGRSAGYQRNVVMHQYISHCDNRGCVAFWDGESRGTQHNFGLAEKYRTPLRVVKFDASK